jgi:hypothetical protein
MPMLSVCTWVDCVGLCIGSSQWEEGGSGFLSKGGLFFVSGEDVPILGWFVGFG